MITLGQIIAWLGVGVAVGAVARLLSHDHERSAWLFVILVSVAGSIVFGFASWGLGYSWPHEPAGFVLTLIGAMLFVSVYLGLRRRLSLP